MYHGIAFVAATSVLVLAQAQAQYQHHAHDHHGQHNMDVPSRAPIKVVINPEARVSVSQGGELPPPSACGVPLEIAVDISNQAVVTAPLEASLVEPVPEHVHLEFTAEPLKGSDEQRVLRITLKESGPVDLTIAFRAKDNIGELGGRDRIHLLMRCR